MAETCVDNPVALADVWALSQITRKVNGAAMLGNAQRIGDADAYLQALGG